jgi:hypothetical protein
MLCILAYHLMTHHLVNIKGKQGEIGASLRFAKKVSLNPSLKMQKIATHGEHWY